MVEETFMLLLKRRAVWWVWSGWS